MSLIEGAPAAVHIGADDLPFVDIGGGNKLKVIQVKEREGLWIVENIFHERLRGADATRTPGRCRATPSRGAWKYKEYDYVNRAGSFLYEPAGSVHTLQCIEDDTRVWFQMYGVNLNLDADGNVESVVRRRRHARRVLRAVRSGGPAPAQRLDVTTAPGWISPTPTPTSRARRTRQLAELRRTDPVYWQEMARRTRVLGGAAARRRRACRARTQPVLGE